MRSRSTAVLTGILTLLAGVGVVLLPPPDQPSQVLVALPTGEGGLVSDHFICGATAIGPHEVITATHCWTDREQLSLAIADVGSDLCVLLRETTLRTVAGVIESKGDVLVLEVEGVPYQRWESTTNSRTLVGAQLAISGWGRGASTPRCERRTVDLRVIPVTECEYLNEADAASTLCVSSITDDFICSGDSGSAAVDRRGQIVGVVSQGLRCGPDEPEAIAAR